MITLICPQNSTRLTYVAAYLTKRLGVLINIQLENNNSEAGEGIRINYTNQAISDHFSVFNEGLLQEDHVRTKDQFPQVRTKDTITQLFPSEYDRYNINFDIFSAIFFCLSRYEEYLPFTADKHGRFTSDQSHAVMHNYLKIPVVDIWVTVLRDQLNERFQLGLKAQNSFCIQPTIDVDSVWAFRHRSLTHKLGSAIKNLFTLNTAAMKSKWKSRQNKDPYDTFEYLKNVLQNLDPIYFILMNFERPHDTAYYVNHPDFASLLTRISSYSDIGLHPSYASFRDSIGLAIEKETLEGILEKPIKKSRQHFLRLSFPDSYELMVSHHVKEDYTMGYAAEIGFRAGTSMPFMFYNVKTEDITDLSIHPFSIMDVTLQQYHKYSIVEALEEVKKMKDLIRETHGCLSFIWHNSSFAEFEGWAGWEEVFEELIQT